MSRSRKKIVHAPIILTRHFSNKISKKCAHKKFRRKEKILISQEKYDLLPTIIYEVDDNWNWWCDVFVIRFRNLYKYEKWMRK